MKITIEAPKLKTYLVMWWDYYRQNIHYIHAETLTEAKEKAFRMMCDAAGDRLYNVDVFELKATIHCEGDYNPRPNAHTAAYATRDYTTGRKIKKGGRS